MSEGEREREKSLNLNDFKAIRATMCEYRLLASSHIGSNEYVAFFTVKVKDESNAVNVGKHTVYLVIIVTKNKGTAAIIAFQVLVVLDVLLVICFCLSVSWKY